MGAGATRCRLLTVGRIMAFGLAAALVLAGCGSDPGATEQGRAIQGLYNLFFAVAAVIFVLVEGLIVWSVVRYRRRDDRLPPQFHGSNLLEVTWTAVPLVIVAVLFVVSWQAIGKVDAKASDPRVRIVVQAFQWSWNFTYAGLRVPTGAGEPARDLTIRGSVATPPELVLPVGEPIRVVVQSKDVIHSFYVPAFNFKRDAIPGRTNSFDIAIDRPGSYHGQCAQFCGLYHSKMVFQIRAVPPADYGAWLRQAVKQAAGGCPGDSTPGQIGARNIQFDKNCLSAKADTPFALTFVNQDPVPHNVSIFQGGDASGPNVFRGELFTGGQRTYRIPALRPGRYFYQCDVHPAAMTGTLVVR
jgi:cytochrome c oxidase subunit II